MKTVIEMAKEAGAQPSNNPELWDIWNISDKGLERFAMIVRAEEHKKFCSYLRQMHDAYALSSYPEGMKPRGENK